MLAKHDVGAAHVDGKGGRDADMTERTGEEEEKEKKTKKRAKKRKEK